MNSYRDEVEVTIHRILTVKGAIKTKLQMLILSVKPLSASIKLQILLLCFHEFITDVVGRSCSNVNRISFE